MSARADALSAPATPWISSARWDLTWLSFSALIVAVPPLVHSYWKVGATGVDLLVTLMIGGPHMYATFLKTVFEPGFRRVHPAITWAPLVVIPTLVVSGAAFAFPWLLTFFFTWASIHVCDQASYIASLYRQKTGAPAWWERFFDFAVIMSALYSYAMYRHVEGSFTIGDHTLWFPPFLKHLWVAHAVAVVSAALIAAWVVRTWNQRREGKVGGPYLLFMTLTIGVAFLVPHLGELSVSFQGFNAWHSFQYLGLTFLLLNRANEAGNVTSGFVRQMARPGAFLKYYGWNVVLTLGASAVVAVLVWGLRLPLEQCYYAVVLSFLLVHYAHDHVLFFFGTRPRS